jgi:murein DD-endopeptidase MepM/ murein hydrolase activator NlpD
MTLQKFGACVVAALVLSACAPDFNPPPDYKGGYLMDTDRSRTVTVQPGDTLYIISRRYDVPTKVIADRNGLKPPYELTVGQTLILDPAKVHMVVEGDTVQSVAQRYGVDQAALIAANELTPPYRLHAGLELWIPDPFTNATLPQVARVQPTDLPPVTAAPRSGGSITSETLAPIGPLAGPSAETLMTLPPTSTPSAPEQAPLSSPMSPQPTVPVPAAPTPAPSVPQVITPQIPVRPVPAATPAAPEVAIAAPRTSLTEPPPRASTHFAWPVVGKLLAKFGPAGKGLHNDGINIAAPAGTQVRAADNGVVAYAGNELKGFGNLLLIKHADGWTTAYAHNEKLLVSRGDKVTQGQVVATVGRTGNVDTPQLHFEVRKGTQAMDPLQYLESK